MRDWLTYGSPTPSYRTAMFSERSTSIREKKFLSSTPEGPRRGHHSTATLTDDHTLFLLNQQRECRSKVEKRSWISRLFRR